MTDDWRLMPSLDMEECADERQLILLADGHGNRSLVRLIPCTSNGVPGFEALAAGCSALGEGVDPDVHLHSAIAWAPVTLPTRELQREAFFRERNAKDAEKPEDAASTFWREGERMMDDWRPITDLDLAEREALAQATNEYRRAKDAEKPEDFEGAFAAFEAERQEREALAQAAAEREDCEDEAAGIWEGFDEDSPPEPDPECRPHDPVERPAHYCQGGIETIDYIEALGIGPEFCQGNAIKYLSRYRMKGGVEDLCKARWYIDRLIGQQLESNKHDPASD